MGLLICLHKCDGDCLKSRTDIPRHGKVMSGSYIKFVCNFDEIFGSDVQDCMYHIAKKMAEDVPHDEHMKANIVDFIADAVPEHMTEKFCGKISSESGMMEVLHNERYLTIKEALYAILATEISDTINNSESLPDSYYISDAGSPDMRGKNAIILGVFETEKMRDFAARIDEMQMNTAWNLICLAGADSHTLTQDMMQNLYGKGSTLFLSSAMDILAGEFSLESFAVGFKDGYMQPFPNREIQDDISKHPENYIAIDLLVK